MAIDPLALTASPSKIDPSALTTEPVAPIQPDKLEPSVYGKPMSDHADAYSETMSRAILNPSDKVANQALDDMTQLNLVPKEEPEETDVSKTPPKDDNEPETERPDIVPEEIQPKEQDSLKIPYRPFDLESYAKDIAPLAARVKIHKYENGDGEFQNTTREDLADWHQLAAGNTDSIQRLISSTKDLGKAAGGATLNEIEQLAKHPIDETKRLYGEAAKAVDEFTDSGATTDDFGKKIDVGAAKALAGLESVGSSAATEAANLLLETPEHLLGVDQQRNTAERNALNSMAQRELKLESDAFAASKGISTEDPTVKLTDLLVTLGAPIGGAEKEAASLISKTAEKVTDVTPRIAGGLAMEGAGGLEAGAKLAPLIGAAYLGKSGHYLEGLLSLGGILPSPRTYINRILDSSLGRVQRYGADILKSDAGKNLAEATRDSMIKESERLSSQLEDFSDQTIQKISKINDDGSYTYRYSDLSGSDLKAAQLRDRITRIDNRAKLFGSKTATGISQAVSDIARGGLESTGHALLGGAIGAGFAGASNVEGDTEQNTQNLIRGSELGATLGAAISPLGIRANRISEAQDRLASLGKDSLPKDHPAWEENYDTRKSLSPEKNRFFDILSGLLKTKNQKLVVLNGKNFAPTILKAEGVDTAGEQAGIHLGDKGTVYLNADNLGQGNAFHETGHALDLLSPEFVKAYQAGLKSPTFKAQLDVAMDRYNSAYNRPNEKSRKQQASAAPRIQGEASGIKEAASGTSGLAAPEEYKLSDNNAMHETLASLTADVLRNLAPEDLFGGRSGRQAIGRGIEAAKAKFKLGKGNTTTTQFGFPATPEMRLALGDSLFNAGKEASVLYQKGEGKTASIRPVPVSPQKAPEEESAVSTPPEPKNEPEAPPQPSNEAPEAQSEDVSEPFTQKKGKSKPHPVQKYGDFITPSIKEGEQKAVEKALRDGSIGLDEDGNPNPEDVQKVTDQWYKENVEPHQGALAVIKRLKKKDINGETKQFELNFLRQNQKPGDEIKPVTAQFGVKPEGVLEGKTKRSSRVHPNYTYFDVGKNDYGQFNINNLQSLHELTPSNKEGDMVRKEGGISFTRDQGAKYMPAINDGDVEHAAIKLKDGQVFTGPFHAMALDKAEEAARSIDDRDKRLSMLKYLAHGEFEKGYTAKGTNEFLNKKQADQRALERKQVSRTTPSPEGLDSTDIHTMPFPGFLSEDAGNTGEKPQEEDDSKWEPLSNVNRLNYTDRRPIFREGRTTKDVHAPLDIQQGHAMPMLDQNIDNVIHDYVKEAGIDYIPHHENTPIDEEYSKKIADQYGVQPHEPDNPEVLKSYDAFRDAIIGQYKTLLKHGYKIEPWMKEGQPYDNSNAMLRDLRENKHLYYFKTEVGYGEKGGSTPDEHPMLRPSGIFFHGKEAPINDIFRGVHDALGHGHRGWQFGPRGERNAFLSHKSTLPPESHGALATETLGQNSWTNFGPHMRNEAGDILKPGDPGYLHITERPYTRQRANLLKFMPQIVHSEARGDSRPVSSEEFNNLAEQGRAMIANKRRYSYPITGLDKKWNDIKDQAYQAAQKSWGGITLDSHTGEIQNPKKGYALSVKEPGQESVSIPEGSTKAEFDSAMDEARKRFDSQLRSKDHNLGVFHDNDNKTIDIDPILIVKTPEEVDAIGAHTHAVGGAYNYETGEGHFPPHVSEGSTGESTQVRNPALRLDDGTVIEGDVPSHSLIEEKIPEGYKGGIERGWTLTNDKFVSNDEAHKIAQEKGQIDDTYKQKAEGIFKGPVKPKLEGQAFYATRLDRGKAMPQDTGKYEGPMSKEERAKTFAARLGLASVGETQDTHTLHDPITGSQFTVKKGDTEAIQKKLNSARLAHIGQDNMKAMPSTPEGKPIDNSPLPGSYEYNKDRKIDRLNRSFNQSLKPQEPELPSQPEPPQPKQQNFKFMPSSNPEAIKSAAIRTPEGEIYTGYNHADAYEKLGIDSEGPRLDKLGIEEGFVTNSGEFLDHKKALQRALSLNQIPKNDWAGEDWLESNGFEQGRHFMPSTHPDAIDKAAIKLQDGTVFSGGLLHDNPEQQARKAGYTSIQLRDATYGWTDKKGRFYDRFEAQDHAKSIDQMTVSDHQVNPDNKWNGGLEGHEFSVTRKFMPSTDHWSDLYNNLTPEERDSVRDSDANKVLSIFRILDPEKGKQLALAGKDMKTWYQDSAKTISHVFGSDADRFTAFLAALSPRKSVEQNLRDALHLWANWLDAGRPGEGKGKLTDAEKQTLTDLIHDSTSKENLSIIHTQIPNIIRSLTADDPSPQGLKMSGPKVNSFFQNLRENLHEVTQDGWMYKYSGLKGKRGGFKNRKSGKPGSKIDTKGFDYLAMNAHIRQVADILTQETGETWAPAEVQAAIWSQVKSQAEGGALADVVSFDKIFKRGDLTVKDLRQIASKIDIYEPISAVKQRAQQRASQSNNPF